MRITNTVIADRPSPLGNTRALSVAMPVNSKPMKMQGMQLHRMESYFLNKGIRVFHLDRFLSGVSTQDNYLRIALASTNSLEELKRGLEILKENLQV
ncbi:hypothetical protein AB4Z22_02820 [Paenibacillus sp. TAF58]